MTSLGSRLTMSTSAVCMMKDYSVITTKLTTSTPKRSTAPSKRVSIESESIITQDRPLRVVLLKEGSSTFTPKTDHCSKKRVHTLVQTEPMQSLTAAYVTQRRPACPSSLNAAGRRSERAINDDTPLYTSPFYSPSNYLFGYR